jgi:hypothetical protein
MIKPVFLLMGTSTSLNLDPAAATQCVYPMPQENLQILVIDDDRIDRELYKQYLSAD